MVTDPLLKILDPLLSLKRLKIDTYSLVRRWTVTNTSEHGINWPLMGNGHCHMTHFLSRVSSHDTDTSILSVRPSIYLSRSGIVSKRLKMSSCFLHHGSSFPGTKHLDKISMGWCPPGALNTGGVYKLCNFLSNRHSGHHQVCRRCFSLNKKTSPCNFCKQMQRLRTWAAGKQMPSQVSHIFLPF